MFAPFECARDERMHGGDFLSGAPARLGCAALTAPRAASVSYDPPSMTTKRFCIVVAAVLVLVALGGCERGPGSVGPAGPQGESGPAGPPGPAGLGVVSEAYYLNAAHFTITASSGFVTASVPYNMPIITAAAADNGIVTVYIGVEPELRWVPLPLTIAAGGYSLILAYSYSPGSLRLTVQASGATTTDMAALLLFFHGWQFRVAVAEPAPS